MTELANHIDGVPCPPIDGKYIEDQSPATLEVLARIPRSGKKDVDLAADAAQAALRGEWSLFSADARAEVLDAIADEIEKRLSELAQLESEDTGKPIRLARSVDIPRAIQNFRFFAGALRHDASACHHMADALNYTVRSPLGVVGLITPWNLPLYLLSWKVAPALAMGNTILAKPSELTPRTASVLAELTAEAGLPRGVFNLVHGLGPEAGQAIVEHEAVSGLSFTGGTATGAIVASTAAGQFKKLSLELGGKNASIVFADADQELAADGVVRAGFLNQGQVCLCGSRILVEASIYDSFRDEIARRVAALRVGDPAATDTDLGALISLGHREKVESYVKLAQEEGGSVLAGGECVELPGELAKGAFFAPTLIDGLPIDCRTATEEIFGPVVTLHPFEDDAEAIRMANGVRYGLAASVWTQDLMRAHQVSAALETGMVWVNTWLKRDLRVPFGGVKDSGVGREGGQNSFEFFSQSKNICIDLPRSAEEA